MNRKIGNITAPSLLPIPHLLDVLDGAGELLEVDGAVLVAVVLADEVLNEVQVAAELVAVALEDQVELLPLDLAVPVDVEGVEDVLQVGLAAEEGLVQAARHELVVVHLPVVIHVHRTQQLLDVCKRDVVDILVLEVLPELLIREVAVSVVVDALEDLPHFVHLVAGKMGGDVSGNDLLQLGVLGEVLQPRKLDLQRHLRDGGL